MCPRIAVFVDGANFHRSLKRARVRAADVDIVKVAEKLARGRTLEGIYYFIARVDREAGKAYEANARLIAELSSQPRVRLVLGFLQRQRQESGCAAELDAFLRSHAADSVPRAARDVLSGIAERHRVRHVFREKGVDVALAIEMVRQAQRDAFDLAFLVSADGDFYPAVDLVRRTGRRVIAASPILGRRLQAACDATVRLDRGWLRDCLR